MGETKDQTLVNPNQLRAYGMIVQCNPFEEAPIFIATEDHDFMIMLSSKGTIIGVTTRTPKDKELQTCPHVTCLSAHEWDPQNVCFPKSLSTVEEEISRKIGAVMTEGGPPELTDTDSDRDSVYQIYDNEATTIQMIGSVKVDLIPSRNVYETEKTVQYVPQAKIFQSKGRHSTVSPEELSDWCQIGLKQARETISKTTQRFTCLAVMTLSRLYKAERVFQTKSLTGM